MGGNVEISNERFDRSELASMYRSESDALIDAISPVVALFQIRTITSSWVGRVV